MTSEDVQKFVRIGVYWISGALAAHGIQDGGMTPIIAAGAAFVANFAWSIYGMRVNAKLAEIAKMGLDPRSPVRGVIVDATPEGRALASAIPGPVVPAGTTQAAVIANGSG